MTVYKYFIKIALKNKGAILAYTAIFFVLSILNGGGNTQKETSFIETKFNIGIIDNSSSELSESLVNYLEKENNIAHTRSDEKYIREQVFLQVLDAVIVIPEDFEKRVINKENAIEIFKDDRNIASYQIENQINKFISFANATYENGQFDLSNVSAALDESIKVNLIKSDNNDINQKANTWFKFYFNFTSYILLALYIAVIGFVMTDFTSEEIESRRKISSIKFLKFNREMYLGQLTIACFITLVFILGSIVLKGKYIGEVNFLKYVVNTIVFSFSALCLVFLINNVTHNKFIISGVSTVLSLGTSFISGVMVPQELLGEKVLTIAKFFPTYYFVKINETNIKSFLDVKYEIFMQLLFAMAFLLVGLYFSKIKQKAH
ncbi:ABC transporter permease [Proteiniborus sp. MB09-C3]|uniref:ABC transporter permease n=1 Tax=Proteiniborus sp. MB09-C3 TaxID=3050072 RepID=UPI002554D39A|nr:ABC transporter permease [Proteiniborus sp. MB09-C3]WIV12965.1 ABC transporter permease [Proteiniborus sp. MB09-C3]